MRFEPCFAATVLLTGCCFGGAIPGLSSGSSPAPTVPSPPAQAPMMPTPMQPGVPQPSAAPFGVASPAAVPRAGRPLAVIVSDFQPSDAADAFVWIASNDEERGTRVQLHCGEHAIEAARRAALRFRGDEYTCEQAVCRLREGGNWQPVLFGEPMEGGGVRLIAYWNGLGGDANLDRIEEWRRDLECGEVLSL